MTATSPNLLLISTVGGAHDPVVVSIRHWRPERVVFLPSRDTRSIIDGSILPELDRDGLALSPGRFDVYEMPDPEDFQDCVRRMRALDEEIQQWLARGGDYGVVVDFTGGTKCMSAALALCARRWPCWFSYVGGKTRTKNGIGVVVKGEERTLVTANPWDALGYQAVDEFVGLFNRSAFGAAQVVAERMRNATTEPVLKRTFATLSAFAEAYGHWDRFQHDEAASRLDHVTKNGNDLRGSLRGDVHQLLDTVTQHAEFCRRLSRDPSNPFLVADLVANARRRGEERRYDDAVARLYRAIEALAQIRLRNNYRIDTSEVELGMLPRGVGARYETQGAKRTVRRKFRARERANS